ncbi:MAG: hypothetical protein ACLFRY_13745 [Spirochaetia bacterium]
MNFTIIHRPLFVLDDNFIGNKKRGKKKLLPELVAWQEVRNYPLHLSMEAGIPFPEAVALAVKGHHFFIITRKILKEPRLLEAAGAEVAMA